MLQEKTVADQRRLEKDSGGVFVKRLSRIAVPTYRSCVHFGACASACSARVSAVKGQSTAGQNEAASIETDTRAVGSQRLRHGSATDQSRKDRASSVFGSGRKAPALIETSFLRRPCRHPLVTFTPIQSNEACAGLPLTTRSRVHGSTFSRSSILICRSFAVLTPSGSTTPEPCSNSRSPGSIVTTCSERRPSATAIANRGSAYIDTSQHMLNALA